MQQEEIFDEWYLKLLEKKASLEQCQASHQLPSCMTCPSLLSCELRDLYVKAVYDSMNKGTSGGFEF